MNITPIQIQSHYGLPPENEPMPEQRCYKFKPGTCSLSDEALAKERQFFIKALQAGRAEGYENIAVIIGAADGGLIQTDPKFIDNTYKKLYIDPLHIQYTNEGVKPDSDNHFLFNISGQDAKNNDIIHHIDKYKNICLYDNSCPTNFLHDNFMANCGKQLCSKHDGEVKLVIGYFDDYPRLQVSEKHFENDENKKQLHYLLEKNGSIDKMKLLIKGDTLGKIGITGYETDDFYKIPEKTSQMKYLCQLI